MKYNPGEVIGSSNNRPEFIACDAVVQHGEVKCARLWSISYSVMTFAPNVPAVQRLYTEDWIIPHFSSIHGMIEKLERRKGGGGFNINERYRGLVVSQDIKSRIEHNVSFNEEKLNEKR